MSADKVKFGIKNCHIFPITSVSGGVPTYGPVIDVPGAVSFSLGAQGDINKFYADNVPGDYHDAFYAEIVAAYIAE